MTVPLRPSHSISEGSRVRRVALRLAGDPGFRGENSFEFGGQDEGIEENYLGSDVEHIRDAMEAGADDYGTPERF